MAARPGSHAVEPALAQPVIRLLDLNAELRLAEAVPGGIEFAYESSARVYARVDALPGSLEIDGLPAEIEAVGNTLILPRGPAPGDAEAVNS